MTTPPGWYPDPGHTGNGPALERWWDGATWTEHTRAPGYPLMPGMPGTPPPPGNRPRGPLIAGISAAVVVAAALVIGSVLVFGGSDGSDGEDGTAKSKPSPTAPESPGQEGAPEDGGPDGAPEDGGPEEGGPDAGPPQGVKLPLLGGWERSPGAAGAAVTTGRYDCPGEKGPECVRGGATVMNAPGGGSPETVAKADISTNAETSYSKEVYGGIDSHKQLEAGKVQVAGQDGYRVRWKIENRVEPDAYVESVAFEHPDGSGQMLVLRTGFDIHDEAPPLSAMDKIVEGVTEGTVEEDDGSSEDV
ncbi:DUF2510 domain-containing protein [Streptomyces armeniacus]|uniref:DUF2510 domain-containing protein n=1 Tax=Streptomyces armeniacus TaxID=83291 RepID=A0A345XZN9_9ACTN|nr:DUF2510 domain-containing protein [Streptomyces armeniacus]AXK37105.1 DUF2510 domain-containing protein [Streptomyces armeniacus]